MANEEARGGAMTVVGQLVVVAVLGIVGVPAVLGDAARSGGGSGAPPVAGVVWLGVGIALVVWLVVLAPRLARSLRDVLAGTPWSARRTRTVAGGDPGAVAFVLVALVDVVLIEATLRPPLVVVLGAGASPPTVDATVAAVCLLAIFALLVRLYLAARGYVEAGAWYALDALLATSGSVEATSRFYDVDTQVTRAEATRRATLDTAATRSTGPTIARPEDAPTVADFDPAAETLAAPPPASDATLGSGASDATLPEDATRPSPDATLPSPP